MNSSIKFTKISTEDIPFVNEVRNSYAKEYLHDSRIFSIEETIEWFNKTCPDFWIIKLADEKIGYFRLSNYSSINRNIYIGADISPEYIGKGYGYSSYLKFIPFLFQEYDLNKITLEVLSNNHRAIHLYQKIGFKYEGRKREEVIKDNVFLDSIIMSILKSELWITI